MRRYLFPCLLTVACLGFTGVGCDNADQTAPAESAASGDALPDGLVLASAPSDEAKGVTETRNAAAEGDRVVMRGVVAGRAEPFAENRAILMLLDESVPTCDRNPADACQTPWDACCEPQEVISENAATVQVIDAEGRPLQTSLAGVPDLKPLSRVIVVGTFVPSPDGKAATVNATGIYVEN